MIRPAAQSRYRENTEAFLGNELRISLKSERFKPQNVRVAMENNRAVDVFRRKITLEIFEFPCG